MSYSDDGVKRVLKRNQLLYKQQLKEYRVKYEQAINKDFKGYSEGQIRVTKLAIKRRYYTKKNELERRLEFIRKKLLRIERPKIFRNNEEIKEAIRGYNIRELFERLGGRSKGKMFHCLHASHEDSTPSVKLYPSTNSYFCFGCGEGGDTLELIQKHYQVDFKKAIEIGKEFI